jgi:hypothetical protein
MPKVRRQFKGVKPPSVSKKRFDYGEPEPEPEPEPTAAAAATAKDKK